MTNTLTRSIDIQEVTDTREFTGLVAPYGEVIEVDGFKERYDKGVFDGAPNVQIYYNHDMLEKAVPIGRVVRFEETDGGLQIVGRISETVKGNEVYTLLKDGVLDSLSAQFIPTQTRLEENVTVYERGELLEVSVVSRSAYPSARISEVRSEETLNTKETVSGDTNTQMTEINYDDSEIRSGLENLERRIEVLANKEDNSAAPAVSKIRSFGDYVKAVSRADEDALAIHRAYTGGTSADSVLTNGWTNDIIKIVEARRPVLNAFDKGTWVKEGSNIEYAMLDTNTIDVEEQVAEGDDLVYGKVAVTSAFAPKKTYGGWTEMTLQEVQDASVNILDTAFKAMASEYAARTEKAVRDALTGATAHAIAGASIATFDGWTEFLVDSSLYLQGKGLAPEFIVVSGDVYKDLAGFSSNSNYLLNRSNGSVNITAVSGDVLNLPLLLVPGTGVATVAHSSAIKTFEQPGAPFNLHDTNIVNLSDQYSVYGRLAVAVQDASALVEVGV